MRRSVYRWLVPVPACFLLQIVFGSFYSIGIFTSREKSSSLTYALGASAWFLAVSITAAGIALHEFRDLPGGPPSRPLALIGAVLMACQAFIPLSRNNVELYIAAIGLGFGYGILYMISITALQAWVPDSPGTATGAVVFCGGVGTLIFVAIDTALAEYLGSSNDAMFAASLLQTAVAIAAASVLTMPPVNWHPRDDGEQDVAVEAGNSPPNRDQQETPHGQTSETTPLLGRLTAHSLDEASDDCYLPPSTNSPSLSLLSISGGTARSRPSINEISTDRLLPLADAVSSSTFSTSTSAPSRKHDLSPKMHLSTYSSRTASPDAFDLSLSNENSTSEHQKKRGEPALLSYTAPSKHFMDVAMLEFQHHHSHSSMPADSDTRAMSVREMLMDKSFWMLLGTVSAGCGPGFGFVLHGSRMQTVFFGLPQLVADRRFFIITLVGVLGRLITGILVDALTIVSRRHRDKIERLGRYSRVASFMFRDGADPGYDPASFVSSKLINIGLLIMQTAALMLMFVSIKVGNAELFAFLVTLVYLTFSAVAVVIACLCRSTFAPENSVLAFSLIGLALGVGDVLGSWLVGYCAQQAQPPGVGTIASHAHDYDLYIAFSLCLSIMGVVTGVLLTPTRHIIGQRKPRRPLQKDFPVAEPVR